MSTMCGPISSSELAVCTDMRRQPQAHCSCISTMCGLIFSGDVHRHEEKAAYMAIKVLELRLNEISPNDTVYKLFEYKELVSYCVTP